VAGFNFKIIKSCVVDLEEDNSLDIRNLGLGCRPRTFCYVRYVLHFAFIDVTFLGILPGRENVLDLA
jgi:hypothetical protein